MEYLIGVIVGMSMFTAMAILLRQGTRSINKLKPLSQSFVVNLIDQVASMYEADDDDEDDEDSKTKIVFAGTKAYWLDDGKFFVAESEGDSVLMYTKREVDTMGMDSVELVQLIKIVEALRSNDEDRG